MERQYFLQDERVGLRPLEDEDAGRMVHWINDQGVLIYLGIPGCLTAGQELEWVQQTRSSKTDKVLGIVDLADGQLVGTVGLHAINRRDSHAMYGISIGERERWGRGLGTAAGMLICDYAFNSLNLNRLHLTVLDYNQRGLKSYERIGFTLEGTLRKHIFKAGDYRDLTYMGLLAAEFNTLHIGWRESQASRYGIDKAMN